MQLACYTCTSCVQHGINSRDTHVMGVGTQGVVHTSSLVTDATTIEVINGDKETLKFSMYYILAQSSMRFGWVSSDIHKLTSTSH